MTNAKKNTKKIVLKMLTFRELVTAPHPSAIARAAFRRGNAAGSHGPTRPARAKRRADRRQERQAHLGGWE